MPTRSRPRASAAALALATITLALGPALAQLPLPPSVSVGAPFTPLATLYSEDFEFGPGGFEGTGNASWTHGTPSVHLQPAVGQGPNVWGTNLDGTYDDRACGYATSPLIDLTALPPGVDVDGAASAARLIFRHWMHAENAWDGGVVQASTDAGATWTTLHARTGETDRMISSTVRECLGVVTGEFVFTGPAGSTPPAPNAWKTSEIDVTPYLGSSLTLRWAFAADTSATYLGWYFDDIAIQLGAGAGATVPIPTIDPAAGVNFTPVVTLVAHDFEIDDGGWTASGTDAWQWGEPVAPPLPPSGGTNVWGTDLLSDYGASECSYLTSPTISIPGADPAAGFELARLSMQLWRSTRSGYDGAILHASIDGGTTWNALTPTPNYDRTFSTLSDIAVRDCLDVTTSDRVWSGPTSVPKAEDWFDVTVDLTQYMGHDVMLRFAFASGATATTYRGVYFDDVLVQVGAAARVDANDPPRVSATHPGWSVNGTNPSWAYGLPSTGPTSTRPVWATNLHGTHNANECSAIVTRPIDTSTIVGLGRLTLTFEHYFDTASTLDAGVIQVSNDAGATWLPVSPVPDYSASISTTPRACLAPGASLLRGYTSNPTGQDYRPVSVSLSAFQGDTILVRFAFASSPTLHDFGWYVRDVAITRGAGAIPLGLAPDTPDDVRVIVWGAPVDASDLRGLDRADALDALAARASPFVGEVRAAVEANGGSVVAAWPFIPAVSVVADVPTLLALSRSDAVAGMAVDSDDAVRLIDPEVARGMEGDFRLQNSEGRNMIQAEDIWALGYMGEGVAISMIDTGIDPNHEAFKLADGSSRIAGWVDYVNGGASPYDDQGHGTHVAGTAVGSNLYDDPARGYYQEIGVAPRATLMVAKFLNSAGSGSFTNAINALNWSYANGADVTSNSWGASGCSSSAYPVMAAVRQLTDLGMASVFAAGNSGPGSSSIGSPACSESAISVGAVDKNGVIASFSSRGPCADNEIGGASRICPDIVAKGYLVRSAAGSGSCSLCHASGYVILNGTSMATPHAAGAIVLAEQMKRALHGGGWDTPARAEEEAFKLTSLDLGAAGEDNTYGWGLPQLLSIHQMLSSTGEAQIIHSFGVSRALLRQSDAATLSFSVRNLGSATASGEFRATLTRPGGAEDVLVSKPIALGLLDKEAFSTTFVATSAVEPGTYTFRGTFAYAYEDENGDVQTGLVDQRGAFDVKRVLFDVALDGFGASAPPLVPQHVTYSATNVGNEDAKNVTIEFTVPDDYAFLPGDGFDPTNPLSRYASPAPTTVREDRDFGRVTLIFVVGDLAVGESFTFETTLVPTGIGAYRAVAVAKFEDGAGKAYAQSAAANQTVSAP